MSATIGLWEHFRKLASFRGREDRSSFWPYAALVFAIVMVAGSAMLVPLMARAMRGMAEYDVQDPGPVTDSYGLDDFSIPAQVDVAGLAPSPGFMAVYLGLTLGLAILLSAAAVVRRLHDRGKSGAWGLMPLPFILYSSIETIRLSGSTIRGALPDMGMYFSIAVSNMLYLLTLGILIALLAGASDPEPNGYDSV